eukprot:307720-Rhodomonas_salina.1
MMAKAATVTEPVSTALQDVLTRHQPGRVYSSPSAPPSAVTSAQGVQTTSTSATSGWLGPAPISIELCPEG